MWIAFLLPTALFKLPGLLSDLSPPIPQHIYFCLPVKACLQTWLDWETEMDVLRYGANMFALCTCSSVLLLLLLTTQIAQCACGRPTPWLKTIANNIIEHFTLSIFTDTNEGLNVSTTFLFPLEVIYAQTLFGLRFGLILVTTPMNIKPPTITKCYHSLSMMISYQHIRATTS